MKHTYVEEQEHPLFENIKTDNVPTCFSWSPRLLASLLAAYDIAMKVPENDREDIDGNTHPAIQDFLAVFNQVAKIDFSKVSPTYLPHIARYGIGSVGNRMETAGSYP